MNLRESESGSYPESSSTLDGMVAVVTGCGRINGMGRRIAHTLGMAGASVAVTDIRSDDPLAPTENGSLEPWRGIESLADEMNAMGGHAIAVYGDVGSADDVERMVDRVVKEFGRIDILVNNAAAPHGGDRTQSWLVAEADFDRVLRVNTKGVFLCSTAVARHLVRRRAPGRIINIASLAGRQGLPQRAVYSASKFAVIGLTQAMAQELASHGVTVNAICPGPIDTSRQASTARRLTSGDEVYNARYDFSTTPVGRLGSPPDIARMVLFFSESASDFITGQSINVDGGFFMN